VPAAKLGADVLGVDIAGNLVEAGNARAQSLGLTNLRFQEGDASDLSELEDGSFDLVITIFGAMFAPKPFDVAKEVVRVTRPGGRIVMGNWIPNDPTLVAQILVVPSPHPRSRTLSPSVIPNVMTSASPLSRMLSAMRVKSPFSQSSLFGLAVIASLLRAVKDQRTPSLPRTR
jgi:ubiquinone/menaquinone biosynthesis C-methylase UbiE